MHKPASLRSDAHERAAAGLVGSTRRGRDVLPRVLISRSGGTGSGCAPAGTGPAHSADAGLGVGKASGGAKIPEAYNAPAADLSKGVLFCGLPLNGSRRSSLLYYVGQFVGQQTLALFCFWRVATGVEYNVIAECESMRVNATCELRGHSAGMDTDGREIVPKARLKECALGGAQRIAAAHAGNCALPVDGTFARRGARFLFVPLRAI
jgi:hypothetical protein